MYIFFPSHLALNEFPQKRRQPAQPLVIFPSDLYPLRLSVFAVSFIVAAAGVVSASKLGHVHRSVQVLDGL